MQYAARPRTLVSSAPRSLLGLVAALLMLLAAGAAHSQASHCHSPRDAVETWVENLQPETYSPSVATRCFDWSNVPSEDDRTQVVRDLLAVLDGQGLYVSYDAIPATADWEDPATGMSRYTLFGSLPQVYVEKDASGLWKVSSTSVAATEQLFQRTYRVPLQRFVQRLPPVFSDPVLGIALWQWMALVLLVLFAVITGRVLELTLVGAVRRSIRHFFPSWDAGFERVVTRRSGQLLAVGLVALVLPSLGLPVRFNQFSLLAIKLAASIVSVLIAVGILDLAFDAWKRRAETTDSRMDDQLIPLMRRAAKILVSVLGLLFVLQNLNVDVGSLLAGLGLGGLAFALAAKDTLANLFGSLTIFADRPFQIGDWVVVGDVEGTIEEVGFRSTRVRTFYDSVVTLPNSKVADSTIDNMGRRNYRRFKVSLSLTYGASPDQIEAFVQGVRESIEQSPYTRKDSSEVHFHTMADSSLDVLVYCFFEVDGWTDELRGRQALMLAWMRLAEQVGVDFAYPTQTLHVESLPATS